jgi:Helix-turn-helix domain
MTLDESVHGMRLRVIERAQVVGNVSAVCRELGISRTLFYRWRTRLERYGIDGIRAGCVPARNRFAKFRTTEIPDYQWIGGSFPAPKPIRSVGCPPLVLPVLRSRS